MPRSTRLCLFFAVVNLIQRNSLPALHALLEADVPRLWPASSASAPHSPVWSAFFRHCMFERHVLGIVAEFAGAHVELLASGLAAP